MKVIVDPFVVPMGVGVSVSTYVAACEHGKPKEAVPAVGLGILLDRQAASLFSSSHCSKNMAGAHPPSDPWGRPTLYS